MRTNFPIVFVFLAALAVEAAAATPEQAWKADHATDNAEYATVKHAILKINDAAYVADGQSVSLVGDPAKPTSWHWLKGVQKGAVLVAGWAGGHAHATRNGKAVSEAVLATGVDIVPGIDVVGAAAQIAPGQTGLRVAVFNQQSAAAKAFKGVDYFPYDPAYRILAHFKPDPNMTPHIFRTSRGWDKQFYHAGDALFTLQGKSVVLPLYTDEKTPAKVSTMTSFFTDGMTGKGAYAAGRYVDVEKFAKFPPAAVTIDFNYAYNPNCARSRFYNCPFAVDDIPLAIKAGERDPHAH
ncbi:MAG: DUF1684 domain-containing protein [Alphaproteobacteria bacterium]|nr:DUF1684 domain-containing protein [Alphaproteobacteria bacterium]